MRHIPHLVIGAPWGDGDLAVSVVQWRHLTKVLRKNRGDEVTYTDGLGALGSGRLGHMTIERDEEAFIPRQLEVSAAVAPPGNKDRQRFLVEKLTELGVARLLWLRTELGKNRPSPAPKVFTWVVAALEQSRGAWLMEASTDLVGWEDLDGPIVVCDQGGAFATPEARTVVVGPEGGWNHGEVPEGLARWNLGPNVLRVETAAIVAAARVLAT